MKTKLVTAIYTHGKFKNFPYYAHDYQAREDRYLHSLRTISNTGLEIILYCDEIQFTLFSDYCKKFNLNNVSIKISNLDDFPYSETMRKIKNKNKEKNIHFYHEIDWNKLYLLKKEIDYSYDYIYWIDAGLSHPGLFPKKCNPHEKEMDGMSRNYYNYSFTEVFDISLFDKINIWVSDKLISLSNRFLFHRQEDLNKFTNSNYIYGSMTVGGIIGGNTKHLKWLIDSFFDVGKKVLEKDTIINHEALLSYLTKISEEKFKTFKFDDWSHPDLEKNKTCFYHFFEEISKNS